ncbi:MAG: lysine--tRNA ligase [Candidatus Aenigmatarchaeota archaeon]
MASEKAGADGAKDSLFWADQLASEIAERKKFHYIDRKMPSFEKFTVKTSASISGVLHIGRLSDTIRGESVVRALMDAGHKAEFIWVAEDMDPLRSVPRGVPAKFRQYIGMPVTDVPDPTGTYKTYAEYHTAKYFEVLDQFVCVKMKKHSTREEYKKGSFNRYIKDIITNMDLVREIQNKYRSEPLPETWSPWKPVCESCGKIITTSVKSFENGKALYRCEDYSFEKEKAIGCGHEGENDPLKGNGKLVWKGEWAAEWALWQVCSEGAGKEYQVPNSAWWVNGEIVEKVLGYPMPVPIFYEHIMIDSEKMSASKGNVVYPADWLRTATPELLRFFYNKKLMKTRSFSWQDLPGMYDDYDLHERVYFGTEDAGNAKEKEHMKRLYAMSQKKVPGKAPLQAPFDFCTMVAQSVAEKDLQTKGVEMLQRTGHVKPGASKEEKEALLQRLLLARQWAQSRAPEKYRFTISSKPQGDYPAGFRKAAKELSAKLREKDWKEEELMSLFRSLCEKHGVKTGDFFRHMYRAIIGKDQGPRLAPFIISAGKDRIARLIAQI